MRKRWGLILLAVVALAGCSRSPAPTPTPIATAPPPASAPRSRGDTVVASGEVVPAQEAQLSLALTGQVQTVAVGVGDEVEPSDLLVTLEADGLEAKVAQAEAAVDAARAQLARLETGPRPEEVAVAEAAYTSALAQYRKLEAGPSEEELIMAKATLRKTEAALRQAQAAYDKIAWMPEARIMPQALNLEQVSLDYASASANYKLVTQGAPPEDLEVAWGNVETAEAQLHLLLAGATDEEIAAAKAAVAQVEAALDAARATLHQATLRAPFAGTIAALEVSTGETVLPGQVMLTLADLRRLRVETIDLSERDVDRVAVGQQASIYVEALGVEIKGRVMRIAPRATKVGGDVVYTVMIDLDEQPPELRWGMSVEVEITTG